MDDVNLSQVSVLDQLLRPLGLNNSNEEPRITYLAYKHVLVKTVVSLHGWINVAIAGVI